MRGKDAIKFYNQVTYGRPNKAAKKALGAYRVKAVPGFDKPKED